jgi:DNA uptake protein ComE-like DNA-binding protein
MYQLAQPHFPGNEKLMRKVVALQDRLREKHAEQQHNSPRATHTIVPIVEHAAAPKHLSRPATRPIRKFAVLAEDEEDLSYHEPETHAPSEDEEEEFVYRPRTKARRAQPAKTAAAADSEDELADMAAIFPSTTNSASHSVEQTPRTKHLLAIINSRDVSQIKLLKGVGAKRAEAIANCLCDLDMGEEGVASLGELGRIKGVGGRMVENMRLGLLV